MGSTPKSGSGSKLEYPASQQARLTTIIFDADQIRLLVAGERVVSPPSGQKSFINLNNPEAYFDEYRFKTE